jgi:hypothetical protein
MDEVKYSLWRGIVRTITNGRERDEPSTAAITTRSNSVSVAVVMLGTR